jgi:hypothetical protein
MSFNKPWKVFTIEPAEKIAINRNETNRKRFLEKFFIEPAGIPLMP